MSINIDLQENPEPGSQPPNRLNVVLSILLAVVIFGAVVVVLLAARQRLDQAALLKGTPTVATKATALPALTTTPAARTSPTAAVSAPTATVAAPVATGVPPTQTRASSTATAGSEPTKAGASPTKAVATAAPTAVVVATAQPAQTDARVWYFGEGASVAPFRTYYSIYNPGAQAAKAVVSLYAESGKVTERTVNVPAGTEVRVLANDILPNAAFSAGISSDRPVYVERLTVGDRDGTTSSGMTPATRWYFAEGQTGDDFTTWLLVLNPNTAPATLTVTYYPVFDTPVVKKYTAPPTARLTIAAQKDVPSAVMAMVVESSLPVVAEHAIYFDGQKAAYGGLGQSALSKTWYVGSGNTQPGFTARLAMFNPNSQPATVKVTVIGSKLQQPSVGLYGLDPLGKDDIVLNDNADEQLVAAIVESDQPIVAEIATYYLSGGENGPTAAYSAPAVPALAKQWYVPEVTANNEYDPYITLFNPGTAVATATVIYTVQGGEPVTKAYQLAAWGRVTLHVSDEVKDKAVVAVSVSSTQPIAVERVTMFRTKIGATASAGIAAR